MSIARADSGYSDFPLLVRPYWFLLDDAEIMRDKPAKDNE